MSISPANLVPSPRQARLANNEGGEASRMTRSRFFYESVTESEEYIAAAPSSASVYLPSEENPLPAEPLSHSGAPPLVKQRQLLQQRQLTHRSVTEDGDYYDVNTALSANEYASAAWQPGDFSPEYVASEDISNTHAGSASADISHSLIGVSGDSYRNILNSSSLGSSLAPRKRSARAHSASPANPVRRKTTGRARHVVAESNEAESTASSFVTDATLPKRRKKFSRSVGNASSLNRASLDSQQQQLAFSLFEGYVTRRSSLPQTRESAAALPPPTDGAAQSQRSGGEAVFSASASRHISTAPHSFDNLGYIAASTSSLASSSRSNPLSLLTSVATDRLASTCIPSGHLASHHATASSSSAESHSVHLADVFASGAPASPNSGEAASCDDESSNVFLGAESVVKLRLLAGDSYSGAAGAAAVPTRSSTSGPLQALQSAAASHSSSPYAAVSTSAGAFSHKPQPSISPSASLPSSSLSSSLLSASSSSFSLPAPPQAVRASKAGGRKPKPAALQPAAAPAAGPSGSSKPAAQQRRATTTAAAAAAPPGPPAPPSLLLPATSTSVSVHRSGPASLRAKKNPWTDAEDALLLSSFNAVLAATAASSGVPACDIDGGSLPWAVIASAVPTRTGKQCRERWVHRLQPGLQTGDWSPEEDATILRMISTHGKKWVEIAGAMTGRSPHAVKNRYYATCRREGRAQSRAGTAPASSSSS